MSGCSPKQINVRYKIENASSSNIFVQYVNIAYDDTSTIQINPTESEIIWEILKAGVDPDWYYDYRVSINYITNSLGDSITFNPNIPYYWQIESADSYTNYNLKILDSSF